MLSSSDSSDPDQGIGAAFFRPLTPRSRREEVYRRLVNAISLGLINAGERLPNEGELARQFQVSVVTVREALAELRERGLIMTLRGRSGGSFVHDELPNLLDEYFLDPTELRDLAQHQAAITGRTAVLAADRGTAHDFNALSTLVNTYQRASSPAVRARAESSMYLSLASVSQSARLSRAQLELLSTWAPATLRAHADEEFAVSTYSSFTALLQALSERHPSRAREVVERHILDSATSVLRGRVQRLRDQTLREETT